MPPPARGIAVTTNAQYQFSTRAPAGALARFGRAVADVLWERAPDAATAAMLRARYGLLGELANADRIVTSHEVAVVTGVMDRDELSNVARALALDAFEDGRYNRFDSKEAIALLLRAHQSGSPVMNMLLNDAMRLALSDGRLRKVERDWLVVLGASFNTSAEGIDARLRFLAPSVRAAA
jgi:hypothetical protein